MKQDIFDVTVSKMIHGGQALGELPDGRKVFVWNALPGEAVRARIIKNKRSYAEAIAEEILKPSKDRIEPEESNYLATSPWQIMTFEAENKYKADIVKELFQQAHVDLPDFQLTSAGEAYGYRNKMEYSFWGDDDGLHLALHQRGSHGKQIVSGSKLAMPAIDTAANAVCKQLSKLQTRAGDLKTIIVRASQNGDVAAALYTKLDKFTNLDLPKELKGLRVYHSNPKSPASVPTKLLYELGDVTLHDDLLGKAFTYDVDSFFQVNVPVFERALAVIKAHCADDPIDMYAGVGSIGLSVAKQRVTLVELDPATAAMARLNAATSGLKTEVIEASTDKTIQSIVMDQPVIFDPPRAGLHNKVVERCLEIKPPQIIYLSCNPATQARDLALLAPQYDIKHFEVYNFFPRTPHIETLAILALKN
jgi:23S rRNA (uracil1939-C5)-methyltransferase